MYIYIGNTAAPIIEPKETYFEITITKTPINTITINAVQSTISITAIEVRIPLPPLKLK